MTNEELKQARELVDFLYKGDINYKKLAETVSLVPRLLDELEWYELNKTKLEAQIEKLINENDRLKSKLRWVFTKQMRPVDTGVF